MFEGEGGKRWDAQGHCWRERQVEDGQQQQQQQQQQQRDEQEEAGGAEGGQEEADVCWEVVMDDVRPISDGAQPPHNHSSACEDIAASCARAGRPTAVVLHGDAHAVRGRRGGWRSTEPSIERYIASPGAAPASDPSRAQVQRDETKKLPQSWSKRDAARGRAASRGGGGMRSFDPGLCRSAIQELFHSACARRPSHPAGERAAEILSLRERGAHRGVYLPPELVAERALPRGDHLHERVAKTQVSRPLRSVLLRRSGRGTHTSSSTSLGHFG